MNSAIGCSHTEPQENVNFNAWWVSSPKCRNWHQNGRVEKGFLSAKSENNWHQIW